MKRYRLSLLLVASMLITACEKGNPPSSDFAVLAAAAEGYASAVPENTLEFPRDHGAHDDFRIEWWYLTASLEDEQGQMYGAQWTLFRVATRAEEAISPAPANPWNSRQVYMAHFALTWPEGHRAWQRYSRGGDHDGISRAGVTASPFAAWMDDWEIRGRGYSGMPMRVRARQEKFALSLEMNSAQGVVLQGEAGFSQKHPGGGGSYYYSQPFLEAQGQIVIDGKEIQVHGQAWLDHEWSSQFLQADQAGWDWFALHLDSGEKLMMFRLRSASNDSPDTYRHGVLIRPNGTRQTLDPDKMDFEVLESFEVHGRSLPLHWRIRLPEVGRDFEITALHPDQWMDLDFPYWEGVILARGANDENSGRGYMELTGYPRQD